MARSKNIMTPPIRKRPPVFFVNCLVLRKISCRLFCERISRARTYPLSRRRPQSLFCHVSILLLCHTRTSAYELWVSESHMVGILADVFRSTFYLFGENVCCVRTARKGAIVVGTGCLVQDLRSGLERCSLGSWIFLSRVPLTHSRGRRGVLSKAAASLSSANSPRAWGIFRVSPFLTLILEPRRLHFINMDH